MKSHSDPAKKTPLSYLQSMLIFTLFALLTGNATAFQENNEPQIRNPAVLGPADGTIPMSSDSDGLGLNIAAPYSTVNEFTGKLNISLDPIGVPGLSLTPIYKSYQEKYCNDESGFRLCPMNEPNLSSVLGEGWNFHLGYIIARNAIYGAPGSTDWERVRFVDTAGNVTAFGRDGVFQADSSNGGASDNCEVDCLPNQADVHFIDDQLRRITRVRTSDGTSLQGFSRQPYYLLDPNGQRTEYRATRLVTHANNATAVTFHPTEIRSPNGRTLTISYVGGSDPDGTLPDLARFDRITDSFGRSMVFHYVGNTLDHLTLEAGNQSKHLKSFSYNQVFAGGRYHTVLADVTTPEGYTTTFRTENIGLPRPLITAMRLPTGGSVEYDYDTESFFYLQPDDSNCRAVRDDDCVELELRSRHFTRIAELRYGTGRYQFDYRQWTVAEERTEGSGEGRVDVTVRQTNGSNVFSRTTSYINPPIFETYFKTFEAGYLVGRPRSKQTTYRGTTLNESWLYTRELNLGGHAGGDSVSVSAVRRYGQQIDGQWIDTDYDYSWYENGNWEPQDFTVAFLQPVKIGRRARNGDVVLTRYFDYINRFVGNFPSERNTTQHQYALALLTRDEEVLFEGSRETLLARTTYQYEDVFLPFATKVERWQNDNSTLTESYSYYPSGVYKGLPHTAKPLGQKAPTFFNAYQYGVASWVNLPGRGIISRTIAFDGTLTNETVNGVTTVYTYDDDDRLTRISVADTAPLITEYTPPNRTPAMATTYYALADETLRLPLDQPFPIAARVADNQVPIDELTFDDWGRLVSETRRNSANTAYTRTYGYSPLGLKETVEADKGRWTYHFDVFGRPTRTEHHDTRDELLMQATDFDYETNAAGGTTITQTTLAQTRDLSSLPIEPRFPATRRSTKVQVSEADIATRLVRTETNGYGVYFEHLGHADGVQTTTLPFNDPSLARVTVTNLLGDLVLETHPEIDWPIHYQYDSNGLLEEQYHGRFNDKKMRRRYRYDNAGRLVERSGSTVEAPYALTVTASFDYDTHNRLIEAVQYNRHEHPVTISYDEFDAANRVKSYSIQIPRLAFTDFSAQPYTDSGEPHRYTIDYTYDALGRVSSIKHPNGGFEAYGYEFDFAPAEVFYGFGPNHPSGPDFVKVVSGGKYHPYNGNNLVALYDWDRCQSQDCVDELKAMGSSTSDMQAVFGDQVFTSTHDLVATFEKMGASLKKNDKVPLLAGHSVDSLGRPYKNRLFDIVNGNKSLYLEAFIQYNAFGFVDFAYRSDELFNPSLFFYDYTDLGQLKKVTMGSAAIEYRYDRVGNLTFRSGLNTDVGAGRLVLDPFSAQYSAGNRFHIDNVGKVYDQAGRLIAKPGYGLGYNAAGHLEGYEETGNPKPPTSDADQWRAYYLYDAFGQRVAKFEPKANKATYSIRNLDGSIITEEDRHTYAKTRGVLTARRQYVIFDGKAVYLDEETYALNGDQLNREETYRFHDRLGNLVVTWDAETEERERQFYEPYGTPMITAMATEGAHGFGGHDEDSTGLVYMKARFYEPVMGCFLQPDAGRDFNPYMPNTYNLYSYTYQNPVNAYDPDGNAVEVGWDVFNIGVGVASFVYNVSQENWGDAAIDAGGVIVDGLAAAIPFVPGGAGVAIKAGRVGDKIVDAAKAADKVADTAKAVDKATDAAKAADKAGDAAKTADKAGDAAKTGDKAGDAAKQRKGNGKNEKHGDGGRAKTKSEKQIEELEKQMKEASKKERTQIKRKIIRIRQDADKKAKGEEHSRGRKR